MPYKDKEKQREYNTRRMQTVRQGNTGGNTESAVTQHKVTQVETVPASYIVGNKGEYMFLPERPRYLKLSDGQVLDRANQPEPNKTLPNMLAANDTWGRTEHYHKTRIEILRAAIKPTVQPDYTQSLRTTVNFPP